VSEALAALEGEMAAERDVAVRRMWLAIDAYNQAVDRLTALRRPTWSGAELAAYEVAEAAVEDALEQVEAWEAFGPEKV
jgi:hypothetical protein